MWWLFSFFSYYEDKNIVDRCVWPVFIFPVKDKIVRAHEKFYEPCDSIALCFPPTEIAEVVRLSNILFD